MNIRRYYVENAVYFITCVTYKRKRIFSEQRNIDLFIENYTMTKNTYSFKMYAHVLMYDHFHWLIKPEAGNISQIMKSVKINFTKGYKKLHGIGYTMRLWQNRFWDHIIRDEKEFEKYFNYIHYNPVKHNITGKPEDYKNSSYLHWVKKGYYQIGWGHNDIEDMEKMEFE